MDKVVWRGRDWTIPLGVALAILAFSGFVAAVGGASYVVGWAVEDTLLDPFVEEIPNANGTWKGVPADLVGGAADRIMSGFFVLVGVGLVGVFAYAIRPRKVEAS